MNNSRKVTENRQKDVQEERTTASNLEKYPQWRQDDGDDDLKYVSASHYEKLKCVTLSFYAHAPLYILTPNSNVAQPHIMISTKCPPCPLHTHRAYP